jgi:hypothetical protein
VGTVLTVVAVVTVDSGDDDGGTVQWTDSGDSDDSGDW